MIKTKKLLKFLFFSFFALCPLISFAQTTITGVVKDFEMKEPMIGVVVNVKSTTNATTTDIDGKFSIRASEGSIIQFSMLGYKKLEKKVTAKEKEWEIILEPDETVLQEVVVEAGIIKRDKVGFTGSFQSFNTEELKSVSKMNVLKSLKSLDPSFVMLDNLDLGSDPNALPNIEIRGQSSLSLTDVQDEASVASNTPLFILDGFEATLQEINDLDVNRIESITILKDAGSTAIYGSKGANGVVVIETVKPKAGKVFISYNGDFQLAVPDLSVYNMMNAEEKLLFEVLSHRYDYSESGDVTTNPQLGSDETASRQAQYFRNLERVQSGVDTYWLSEPVRIAFTQGHSVSVSGGENQLQYSVGVNYKSNQGVMKDEYRNTYGGNVKLIYRGIEGLSISNNLFVSGSHGHAGSWGSFEDFVNANPYYTKYNEDGTIPKYLDEYGSNYAANPLYNASLLTRSDNEGLTVTNNTAFDWNIMKGLLIRGSLGLKKSSTNSVNFVDPRNTTFDNTTYDKKGTYTSSYSVTQSYNANLSVNYLKSINNNNFTLIARGSVEESNYYNEGLTAVGFPEGAVGFPSQSFSYKPDSRPSYTEKITRTAGFVSAFNYNYAYRYLLDFNYNLDGSTNFGKNKRFQNFWSAGLGWNVHREPFAKDWKWLNELKLKATYGTTGNQTGNYVTTSIFSYYVGNNFFGQSSYLSSLGNPNLRWQVVENLSGGVDVGLLDNNLKLNFEVYKKITDPLVIPLEQKASSGVSSYPVNLGYLDTKGYEFRVYYNVVHTEDFLLGLRFVGSHNYSIYGGFADALSYLNDAYQSDKNPNQSLKSLQRYEDGRSPQDLWAVRSLGIDPATGREVFLTKDGEPTYIYDPDDRVVIANSRPDLEGSGGFTVRYKKIMLSANLRYSFGAYKYNSALFNKVENISSTNIIYNQDKRALYERWHQAGDIAYYKKAGLSNNSTPTSSRFIQKDNYLRGESFQLTWNFTGDKWLEKCSLKDLSISLSMEDFFNLYSIKIERGITDPFQRAVSLNLSARF
ncbi:MAG: SusC/RagA family TonB-linked outer membrane protein [Dysgonamonadaceae bacterium]|jgi:TonB-linked SusC/RagA family outer membrane protein|nr:SusC/RagA family TonB-linked outer membrane protein [Dysgonamonadaceae bacterium]